MANNCEYVARIVGRKRKDVERFIRILDYRDKEGLCCRRTFRVCCDGGIEKDSDSRFYYADIYGDVAWSVAGCWISQTRMPREEDNSYPNGKPMNHHFTSGGKKRFANLRATVLQICELLDCSIEIWSREPGMGFQEHYLVNHDGELVVDDSVDWAECDYKEDLNTHELKEVAPELGGFEDYGDFRPLESIYGRDL